MKFRSEVTPIGRQYVIPGAERLTDRQIAERKAQEAMRATKAQKPCDIGLFSDEAVQIDLVEMLQEPMEE